MQKEEFVSALLEALSVRNCFGAINMSLGDLLLAREEYGLQNFFCSNASDRLHDIIVTLPENEIDFLKQFHSDGNAVIVYGDFLRTYGSLRNDKVWPEIEDLIELQDLMCALAELLRGIKCPLEVIVSHIYDDLCLQIDEAESLLPVSHEIRFDRVDDPTIVSMAASA